MIAVEKKHVALRHEAATPSKDDLLALIRQIAEQSQVDGRKEVAIDFSKIGSLGSELVNVLIRQNLTLRDRNQELVLTDVQPSVANTLRLLRLDRSFRFVETCPQNGQPCQAHAHLDVEKRSIASIVLARFRRRREQRRVHLRELHSMD